MDHDSQREEGPVTGELLRQAQEHRRLCAQGQDPGQELTRAWDQFYAACHRILLRRVQRSPVLPQDHDDVVQRAWTKVLPALPDFRDPGDARTLEAWLGKILQRQIQDFRRYQARHPAGSLSALDDSNEPADQAAGAGSADDPAGIREQVAAVLEAFRAEVSPENFRLLELRYLKGWAVAAIAAVMGVPRKRVSARLYLLLARLRARWPALT